jgi:hypothetical protein
MIKYIISSIIVLVTFNSFSQNITWLNQPDEKNKIIISWGYNRSAYTNSDINFNGNDYNFTFEDVKATDRQSKFDPSLYFGPSTLTIPQYNLRIGYNHKGKWLFSFNADHMKYVIEADQQTALNGTINVKGFERNGTYKNNIQEVSNFMYIEHTDGLNYVNLEATRLWNLFNIVNKNDQSILLLDAMTGVSAGVLYPRTNAKVLNFENNDKFHISGFGLGTNLGLQFTLFKFITLENTIKAGYINMPNIATTNNTSDRARQEFGFLQYNFQIGGKIYIK